MTHPIPRRPEEVTAAWLGGVLRADVRSVEAAPIGTGQTGATYRLTVQYGADTGLPSSFAIKLPSQDDTVRDRVAIGYRSEHAFYRDVADQVQIPIPRSYHCEIGGDGAELHDGSHGFDFIYAGNGADTLNGGRDGDNLFGGGGNDVVNAGSGADLIAGGTGADVFVFVLGNQSDTITDFNPWQGDRLQLSRALWANEALTTQQVLDRYAYVNNGAVEINFWNGDSVTLRGFNSLNGFAGWIDLI